MPELTSLQKQFLQAESTDQLFTELGLINLPEDKKNNLLQSMIITVIDRVLLRIEPLLTNVDKEVLKNLEQREDSDDKMVTYLISIVPNFDKIATEEMIEYKKELKGQINMVMQTFDKEDKS